MDINFEKTIDMVQRLLPGSYPHHRHQQYVQGVEDALKAIEVVYKQRLTEMDLMMEELAKQYKDETLH